MKRKRAFSNRRPGRRKLRLFNNSADANLTLNLHFNLFLLHVIASTETPISRPIQLDYVLSTVKGVVFTSTGEILATPSPAEFVNLFNHSPKIGLNVRKVFDFEEGDSDEKKS